MAVTARAAARVRGAGPTDASAAAAACPAAGKARPVVAPYQAAACAQAVTEGDAGRRPASVADADRMVAAEHRLRVARTSAAEPCPVFRALRRTPVVRRLAERPDVRPLERAAASSGALATSATAPSASSAVALRYEDGASAGPRGQASAVLPAARRGEQAPEAVQVARPLMRPAVARRVAAVPPESPAPAAQLQRRRALEARRRSATVPRPAQRLRPELQSLAAVRLRPASPSSRGEGAAATAPPPWPARPLSLAELRPSCLSRPVLRRRCRRSAARSCARVRAVRRTAAPRPLRSCSMRSWRQCRDA